MPRTAIVIEPQFYAADWYWWVGGDKTQVYSSAAVGYVPSRDPRFTAWVVAGHTASAVATEQDLWDYLNGRVLNGTPPTATSTDPAKQERIDAQLQDVIYQVAFSHENRLRALESQPPITQDAFLTRIKGLMK